MPDSRRPTYTGADYAAAASKKTDWATADHMRRAMFDALNNWKNLPEGERTPAKGRELWVNAPLHDPILQKAGTAQIVSEYYRHITNNASDKDIMACLNSMRVKDIESVNEGLKTNSYGSIIKAAQVFSEASKKYLHIETLTDSYQDFLKTHQAELGKIILPTPKPFTQAEISSLNGGQSIFNTLDGIDNALSKVGMGSKGVAHKMADFDKDTEEKINQVLVEVEHLKSGNPQKIQKALERLEPMLGDKLKLNMDAIKTPLQANHIANELEHGVMNARIQGFTALKIAFVGAVPEAAALKPKSPAEQDADYLIERQAVGKAHQTTRTR